MIGSAELERQRALRAKLARLVGAPEPVELAALGAADAPIDVVVTHAEVGVRHGTGVLLGRLFRGRADVLVIRSREWYGGEQSVPEGVHLAHGDAPVRRAVFERVADALRGRTVRRILCVPYFPDEAWTAIALREIHGAPLCTFVMDDQNIEHPGIPDALLRDLLDRSDLRLAISTELRDAYGAKFGHAFSFVPPVVEPELILRRPEVPGGEVLAARRGAIVGNIWGPAWLEGLRRVVRGSGIDLDWYSNLGNRWITLDPAALAADGIRLRGSPEDGELISTLRRTPYVVVPSGTGAPDDEHRFIARLSLPSKIPFVLATSHAPIVVVGEPTDAAARFVRTAGIGVVVPYDRAQLAEAVAEVCSPEAQARMRGRAAALAPALSSEGALDWIWRSLAARGPVDDRWGGLARVEEDAARG